MKRILISLLGISALSLLGYAVWQSQKEGENQVFQIPKNTNTPSPDLDEVSKQRIVTFTQKTLKDFQQENVGKDGWQDFVYQGIRIPVSDGLDALNAQIDPRLEGLLDQQKWGVYSCRGSKTAPTFTLRIKINLFPNYDGDLFTDTKSFLTAWESTMLNDVGSVLFPTEYYPSTLQNQPFTDSTQYQFEGVRQAVVNLSNNQSGVIGYQLMGDYVLISNNIDCMITDSESLVELVV